MLTNWFLKKLTGKPHPVVIYGYIMKEIIKPFFGAALFFVFVLLMLQIIRMAAFFIVHSVPIIVVLRMMLYMGLSFRLPQRFTRVRLRKIFSVLFFMRRK